MEIKKNNGDATRTWFTNFRTCSSDCGMSSAEVAELSVKAVRNGEADVLMKGTSQQRIF